jgi:hypothetical protein
MLLLRWLWRINPWSKVTPMIAAAGVSIFLQLVWPKWVWQAAIRTSSSA